MLGRKYELIIPYKMLESLAFYDGEREFMEPETVSEKDRNYRQKHLQPQDLPWRWFVDEKGACIRAFYLDRSIRVLGWQLSKDSPAAFDIPKGLWLVHDMSRIWAVSPEDFEKTYISTTDLLSR